MKLSSSAASALAAFLIVAAAPVAPNEPERPITIGKSYTIQSTALGDTRQVNVWLPADYDASSNRYPVVYLLDGATDQDFHHIAGLANLASSSQTFGPFIVVGIQTRKRVFELTQRPADPRYVSEFPETGGVERFRRLLHDEVIPFVDARYRTSGRRVLMGESLAGLFVVDTLLNAPALFDGYVAISPSVWWDDRRLVRSLPSNWPSSAAGKKLFLAMADEGGTMQDGVDRLRQQLSRLPANVIKVNYVDYSRSATHSTVYHRAAESALRWLFPVPSYDPGPMPWYLVDGASPPPSRR